MPENFGERRLAFPGLSALGGRVWAAILLASLLVGLAVSPALSAGPAQPPRPPLGGGGSGDGDGKDGGDAQHKQAVVRGEVLNWGYRNEPNVKLTLGNGGWELTQLTSNDGRYQFGPLGGGMAVLRLNMPEDTPLKATATEVVVQTTGNQGDDIVANFALYSGNELPKPPAHLTVKASTSSVRPGDRVSFDVKIQNDLPNGVSNVKLLVLFPWDFVPTEVQGNRGGVMVCDDSINKQVGRLVTIDMGKMATGATDNLKIAAALDKQAASGKAYEVRITLLYAESIMDPQVVKLNGGAGGAVALAGGRPSKLPMTGGVAIPLVGLALAALLLLARQLRSAK